MSVTMNGPVRRLSVIEIGCASYSAAVQAVRTKQLTSAESVSAYSQAFVANFCSRAAI
jgi:hypothetical protein